MSCPRWRADGAFASHRNDPRKNGHSRRFIRTVQKKYPYLFPTISDTISVEGYAAAVSSQRNRREQ